MNAEPLPSRTFGERYVLLTEKISESLWVMLLVFAPVAFGVRHAWSELVFFAIVAAAGSVWISRYLAHPRSLAWHPAFWIVLLFLGWVTLQLAPLPRGVLEFVSAKTVELKSLGLPGGTPDSTTLSFNTHATWHAWRLVVATAAVFVISLTTFRRSSQLLRLMTIMCVIGTAVAAVALAQSFFGNGRVYGLFDLPGADKAGPLVNYNNFAQYMLLNIGVTLALLLHPLHVRADSRIIAHPSDDPQDSPGLAPLLGLGSALILQAAALINSGSRGALLAAVGAFILVSLWAMTDPGRRPWASLFVFLLILLFVLGGVWNFGALEQKFKALAADWPFRWTMASDLWRLAGDFPLTGIGLGAVKYVYPIYQTLPTDHTVFLADTEYPQLLAETGWIGLALVTLFVAWVLWEAVRTSRESGGPLRSCLYGLGFALLAVLIHSAGDFGQRRPVNAILSALICAIVFNISRLSPSRLPTPQTGDPSRATRAAVLALFPLAVALAVVCLQQAYSARAGERHWQASLKIADTINKPEASIEQYRSLIAHLHQAVEHDPGHIEARYWLNQYRWQALILATRQGPPQAAGALADRVTRGLILDLKRLQTLCPTYGRAHRLEGTALRARGEKDKGLEKIRLAHKLAPQNSRTCYLLGTLEAEAGHSARARELLIHAYELEPGWFRDVVRVMADRLSRPDWAIEMAGDHYANLQQVAALLDRDPRHAQHAALARSKALQILEEKCKSPQAQAHELADLASIKAADNLLNEAADYYRLALNKDYGQVDWRLERAKVLIQLGRNEEAIRELRVCLRLRPQYSPAAQLLSQLHAAP